MRIYAWKRTEPALVDGDSKEDTKRPLCTAKEQLDAKTMATAGEVSSTASPAKAGGIMGLRRGTTKGVSLAAVDPGSARNAGEVSPMQHTQRQ